RRIELECAPARGDLGVPEYDADLLTQLVDEHQRGVRTRYCAGQLAQGLRHQSSLDAGQRVAHVALDLRARDQGGDGVDDDDVDGVRADQGLADLEGLLARIRLRYQQVVDVDAALRGILGVESVLDID